MNSIILPVQAVNDLETVGVYHGYLSWIITLAIVLIVFFLIWKILIPFLKHCLGVVVERDEKNIKLMLATFEHAINKVVDQLSRDIQEVRSEIKDFRKN